MHNPISPFGKANVEWLEGGDCRVSKTCTVTGKTYLVIVPYRAVEAYQNGALLQDALKGFDADQREFFKTGITPAEWNSMLPEED